MRGRIDLKGHKLAGLYRPPPERRKHRGRGQSKMQKMPGGNKGMYWMLWRLVDGAVYDTFERHPNYLTSL